MQGRRQKASERHEAKLVAQHLAVAVAASPGPIAPDVLSLADCDSDDDNAASDSGSDSSSTDPSLVDLAIDGDPSEGDGSGDGDASDLEIVDLVPPLDGDKPIVLVPLIPAPHVEAVVAPPDALPDPPFEPPKFGSGVQCAEIGGRVAVCNWCKLPIPKGDVRFVYKYYKSQPKYMHPTCWDELPLTELAYSKDSLSRQLEAGGIGAKWVAIEEAITKVP